MQQDLGLYNNAGIEGKQASIMDYAMAVFKKVIDINLLGVFYGLRYGLPVMQQQQYGRYGITTNAIASGPSCRQWWPMPSSR